MVPAKTAGECHAGAAHPGGDARFCHVQHLPGVQTSVFSDGHTLDQSLSTFVSSQKSSRSLGMLEWKAKLIIMGFSRGPNRMFRCLILSWGAVPTHSLFPSTCEAPAPVAPGRFLFLRWLGPPWSTLFVSDGRGAKSAAVPFT